MSMALLLACGAGFLVVIVGLIVALLNQDRR
jgi:hypothetical protein